MEDVVEQQQPLLLHPSPTTSHGGFGGGESKIKVVDLQLGIGRDTWEEVKKVWEIAAPSIFCRLAMFSLTIITQSLAGHLSDLDLAAFSIVTTLLISISFGFLGWKYSKEYWSRNEEF